MRGEVLGNTIDGLTYPEVLNTIQSYIQSGTPHYIAITNAAKFWRMEKDERLKRIVNSASLILAEKAVVMGGTFLGKDIPEPILGISLFNKLLIEGNEKQYRVFFFGAQHEVITRLVNKIQQDYPGLIITGFRDGYVTDAEMPLLIAEIKRETPDILFVAMGTPKQEYWIQKYQPMIKAPVCIGLGGSFDVVAGYKKDAPEWVRAIAMEWLFRTLQDPRNLWKRYAITIPWFISKIFLEKFRLIRKQSFEEL